MFPNLPSRGDGRRSSSHRAQGNGACEWTAVAVISSWVLMEKKNKGNKVNVVSSWLFLAPMVDFTEQAWVVRLPSTGGSPGGG